MRQRFTVGKHSRLCIPGQADVAMARSMNVHEHFPADVKSIFVNSRTAPFRNAGQTENSLPEVVVEAFSPAHRPFPFIARPRALAPTLFGCD